MEKTSLYDATVAALDKIAEEDAPAKPVVAPKQAEKPEKKELVDPLTRPPVFELLDRENAALLDDSDRRWLNRGKKEETAPEVEEAPKNDASGVLDRFSDQIGGVIEERIRDGLEGQIQQIEERVADTVRTSIRRNLFRIALFVVLLIWIANVFGAAIVKCLAWVGHKIKLAMLEAMYRVNDRLEEKFKGERE